MTHDISHIFLFNSEKLARPVIKFENLKVFVVLMVMTLQGQTRKALVRQQNKRQRNVGEQLSLFRIDRS